MTLRLGRPRSIVVVGGSDEVRSLPRFRSVGCDTGRGTVGQAGGPGFDSGEVEERCYFSGAVPGDGLPVKMTTHPGPG